MNFNADLISQLTVVQWTALFTRIVSQPAKQVRRGKTSAEECIFDYTSIHFECRATKTHSSRVTFLFYFLGCMQEIEALAEFNDLAYLLDRKPLKSECYVAPPLSTLPTIDSLIQQRKKLYSRKDKRVSKILAGCRDVKAVGCYGENDLDRKTCEQSIGSPKISRSYY